MSRYSLAYILSRLYSLHQPQYPTTALDVIYSILQFLLSRNTFLHFSTSQKATPAAAYFCLFITTESKERLAITSPHTISMRYETVKSRTPKNSSQNRYALMIFQIYFCVFVRKFSENVTKAFFY